jgi:hypothetical protein
MRRTTCGHVIKCACSTAPEHVHAMHPDLIPNSGDSTAARSVMRLGIIRKRGKHLSFARSIKFRPFIKYACATAPQNVHAMCPDRIQNSGDDTAARSEMHLSMIPKWRKHLHFTRIIKLRPFIKCACATAPHNLDAMSSDRISNSGDYTAVRSVMHLGMIPKWRKHQHYMRRTACRHNIKCACSTAPHKLHAM